MERPLSPQTEQFLADAVASGMFPSKEAAIDAAIEALREKTEPNLMVPDEHMEEVEAGIRESRAGLATPMTAEDWAELRQYAHDVAAQRARGE